VIRVNTRRSWRILRQAQDDTEQAQDDTEQAQDDNDDAGTESTHPDIASTEPNVTLSLSKGAPQCDAIDHAIAHEMYHHREAIGEIPRLADRAARERAADAFADELLRARMARAASR
jgi:hypothetical protein